MRTRTFSTLATLSFHVLQEQWKNRFFQLILIFAGVMLYSALLLGAMAVEQELRVLTDFGLGLIELVGLAAVIFGCATTVLKDIESKTIYLVLSRPVPRHAYLLGMLFGLFISVGLAMACMGLLHSGLLYLRGFSPPQFYLKILFLSWLKTVLIGCLAQTVSLFSTSVLSSVVITGIFWTLGHFLSETRFLLEHARPAASVILTPLLYAVPDLQLYNLKDRWDLASGLMPGWTAVTEYTFFYSGACVLAAVWLFRKKEF